MVSITVKAILPKKNFADKGWRDAIIDMQRNQTAPDLKKMFRDTTNGWENVPSFSEKLSVSAFAIGMEVYTTDKLYHLINVGSPAHRIPTSGTTYMRFRPGYRASTTPRGLKSRKAYRSGAWRTAFSVRHPGFEAREFDRAIAEAYFPKFEKNVQKTLNEVARR